MVGEVDDLAPFSWNIVHLKLRTSANNDGTIGHPFHWPIVRKLVLSGMIWAILTPDIELFALISEVLSVIELASPMHNTCDKILFFLKNC